MMLPGLVVSCPQIKNKMTFHVFTELDPQEKFSPGVGVLCASQGAVITYFCKHWPEQPGPRRVGSQGAWGQGLRSVIAGCGHGDEAAIAPIPQLHRGGSMGWEVRVEQFATVSRRGTVPFVYFSLPHTLMSQARGWLGSQVP